MSQLRLAVRCRWLTAGKCAPGLWARPRRLHTRAPQHAASFWTGDAALAQELPKKADVVVVGGGVAGTSIAYHLAKMTPCHSTSHSTAGGGDGGVVLLEKSELTAGSTWHAAGLTTTYHPGLNLKRVHWDSMELYSKLEAETGQAVGLHRNGSVRLAETPTRMDEFRLQQSKAAWYPAPARIIDVDEIKEKCPLINTDGLLGGYFTPYDGYIDPYSVTMALGAGARMYGAKIYINTEVTEMNELSVREDADARWEVKTPNGTIQCRHVVNATGFWGREVDALKDRRDGFTAKLPLIPVHHQYCITDSLPEVQALEKEIPVMRDLHGSYYIRMERDGLLVGPYEAVERTRLQDSWLTGCVTPGFGRELFENDLDRIGPYLEAAVDRFPAFGKAPIMRTVAGPITYAPDGLPMVGPKPGYPGMWLAVGFGYGIIHGGGIGRYLAQWMKNGYPPYDLTEADPARYGSWADDTQYVMNKARESYGMNNSYGYVKEERKGGRPTQRAGPLYSALKERGAQFGFKVGFEVPLWFERPGDESGYKPSFHRTNWFNPVGRESKLVREAVGVMDLSSFATFKVAGPDAHTFLSYVFANKIPKAKGRSCLAHMLMPNGRVMSEMTVTCTATEGDSGGAEYMLTTGGGSELHDVRWLEQHHHCVPCVTIENTTERMGCLGVAGPKSPQLMERLFPGVDFSRGSWPLMSHRHLELNGVELDVMRLSYTGELGWEIHCPKSDVQSLYCSIHALGKDLGVDDFGMYAMNSLRMEKGFRAWGAEISKDNTIVEAGMMAFVRDAGKMSFIGSETVEYELANGSKEQLVMLRVVEDDGQTDPDGSEAVYCDGKVVGHVSSGCYAYQAGHGLAFAYVPPFLAEEGLEVEIDVIGKRRRCVVIQPPVPADHLRLR